MTPGAGNFFLNQSSVECIGACLFVHLKINLYNFFFGYVTKVLVLPLKNEYVTVVSVPPACENVLMAFQLCVRFSFLNPGNAPVPFVQGCQMRRARRRWR